MCEEVVVVVVVGSGGHDSSGGGTSADWERLCLDFERDRERARKKLYSFRLSRDHASDACMHKMDGETDDREPGRLERTLFSDFLVPTTSFIFGINIMHCSEL